MAIGLKEGRRMAARARRWTLVKRMLLLAALIAVGVFAYETGATRTQYRIDRMEERLAAQDADIARLEAEKAELDRRRLAAVQGERALQARYDRDVPTGERKALFEMLVERINAGLDEAPDRFPAARGGPRSRNATRSRPPNGSCWRRLCTTAPTPRRNSPRARSRSPARARRN